MQVSGASKNTGFNIDAVFQKPAKETKFICLNNLYGCPSHSSVSQKNARIKTKEQSK